jgi:predicted transporter
MEIVYILVVALGVHAFISTKVNTENCLILAGLVFIVAGALVDNYQLSRNLKVFNPMNEIGLLLYLFGAVWHSYFRKRNKRQSDRQSA